MHTYFSRVARCITFFESAMEALHVCLIEMDIQALVDPKDSVMRCNWFNIFFIILKERDVRYMQDPHYRSV